MKIECIKEKLEEMVTKISHFTTKNETLPVLECAYLEAKGNELLLRATNLELGIEVKLPVKVIQEGKTAVPATILKNLLSGIGKEKKVVLETSRENLTITSAKNTSLIKSYKVEDFPTIPRVNGNEVFSLNSDLLEKGVKSVWYSASTSFVKPEISSIYIYKSGDELVFVATDSFRLAEKKIPLKNDVNFTSVMIPYRNMVEIIRVFEGLGGSLQINTNNNQISFETEDIYLTSRLVDGVFPDYKQIIPKEFSTEVVSLTQDLLNAVKVTNIFADKFFKILFKMNIENKRFEIEARNADVGENTTKIDAKISGEDLIIAFNYRYILEALQNLKDDSVSLDFSGEGKALVMRGLGDNSFTYLVMPMNH